MGDIGVIESSTNSLCICGVKINNPGCAMAVGLNKQKGAVLIGAF
jgi:hypothetical protein